jgi:hypothetical protein
MPQRDSSKDFSNDPEMKEIRQEFEEDQNAWDEIREEARTDMRYLAGDPWDNADKRARMDAGRPCINIDQLNQFGNQTINNIRQNKRDGELIPEGFGANDADARLRENAIRGIKYKSKAASANITALQNAVWRGYGFERILTTPLARSESNELGIIIKPVPNPDTITIDPDFQAADGSDMKRAYVLDLFTKKEFRERFGKTAKYKTFGPELMRMAPGWIRSQHVQVAERWKVKNEKVTQQIVNGVEILEENAWAGSVIPIPCCFGQIMYVDYGSGPERIILSLVRLARDPQMLLAYLASLECEVAGMTPKTPYVGAKGQFESDSEAWEYITKVARAYVQYDPIIDQASGQPFPPPRRENVSPDFAPFEMAKDAAIRGIMGSMGTNPLPVAAQRVNEKSGIAIQRIQSQESIGSYHFVDNYDAMLENEWRQLNKLLDVIIDTPRDIPSVKKDGTKGLLRVNDPEWAAQNPNKDHLMLGEDAGDYGATVIIGPSQQSEREAVSEFVDNLISSGLLQQLPGPIQAKVLARAIKMRNLGPQGEELADTISPPDNAEIPPAAQAIVAQLKAQIQQLQQELAANLMERKGKVLELQTKERIAARDNATEVSEGDKDRVTKVAVAEISTKAQLESERQQFIGEFQSMLQQHAHEVGMMMQEHRNALRAAQQQAALQPTPVPPQQAQEPIPAQ